MQLNTDPLPATSCHATARPENGNGHETAAHGFAQQIAAFYPYPPLTTPRADETIRNDAVRGPAASSRYPGHAQRRHGRDSG